MSINLKIIKLVTPTNETFNIEISGDENELIDLISMITGIPQYEIKGIKDCYGTYYTISSAVSNSLINSEFSDFFYLVCNPNHVNQNQVDFYNYNYNPNHSNYNDTNNYQNLYSYNNQKIFKYVPSDINNYNFNQRSMNNSHGTGTASFNNKINFNSNQIAMQNMRTSRFKNSHARLESSQNSINNTSGNNLNNSKHINTNNKNVFNYNLNRQIYEPQYKNYNQTLTTRVTNKFPNNNLNINPNFCNKNALYYNNNFNSSQYISTDENIINNKNILVDQTNSFSNPLNEHFQSNCQSVPYTPHFTSPVMTENSLIKESNNIDNYISLIQGLYDENQLDSHIFSQLTQMILKENEEVTNLIKIYLHHIIDTKSFVSGLNKIITKNTKLNSRPNSPILKKGKLINLLEKVENEINVKDQDDMNLLKELVEFENEFIMGAFEVYESDMDLENFIESLKILLHRIKTKSNTAYGKGHISTQKKLITSTFETMDYPNNLQNDNPINFPTAQNLVNVKKFDNIFLPDDENQNLPTESKNELVLFKCKNYNSKTLNLSKESLSFIFSNLHTLDRIIFKYAVKSKLPEMEALNQLYKTFQKEELLIKPIKELCKKFINENLLKELNENQKLKFFENLSNKEKHKELLDIFQNFKDHQDVNKLEREINDYMKKDTRKKQLSSSESEFLMGDEESLLKKGETTFYRESIKKTDSSLEEIVQLIKIMKFLKSEEKKELYSMVENKNKQVIEIFETYFKNKNTSALKISVLNLIRQIQGLYSNQTSTNNINSCDSRKNSPSISFSNKNNICILQPINNQINIENCKDTSYQGKIFEKLETTNNNLNITTEKSPRSFENLIDEITKSGKISTLQSKLIIQKYKNNDDFVNSIWESYTQNKDHQEFIESIILSANYKMNVNPLPVTPADTREKKKEMFEFLNKNPIKKEKETVKVMQYNMIKILVRDNLVDKSALPLLRQMISEENPILITIFEVFGVTKDHLDFSHTLNSISNLYNNNVVDDEKKYLKTINSEKELSNYIDDNSSSDKNHRKDSREDASNNIEKFLNRCPDFKPKEKEILIKKFNQKNINLMSSYELYEINNDEEELVETLKIILRNNCS